MGALLVIAFLAGPASCRCDGPVATDAGGTDAAPPPACVTFDDAAGSLEVCSSPFSFALRGADGRDLVRSAEPALTYAIDAGVSALDATGAFVDPALPGLPFRAAGPALAYDAATRTFTLATEEADLTVAVRVVRSGEPGAPASGELSLETTFSDPGRLTLVRWSLAAGPADEGLYGLGETFAAVEHRGRLWPMQLRISGTSDSGHNETHYPVPLLLSTRGWGAFAESTYPGAFDLGSTDPAVWTITYAAPALPLRLYPTPAPGDPLAVLDPYTARTGRPAVPATWSFAPQQWRNEWADAAEVLAEAMTMRALDLPGSCMWIDNPWQTAYNTFEFNLLQFPDPAGLIAQLNDLGYRVIVWSTPYLNTSDDSEVRLGMAPNTGGLREEAEANGYLVTLPNGMPYPIPWGDGRVGTPIDWTNPAAFDWWKTIMRRATDVGVEGWKLDYHEDIVVDLIGNRPGYTFSDGSSQNTMHRTTCNLEHRAYAETVIEEFGAQFLLTRCGTFGDQSWIGAVWPGDLDNDFSEHDDVVVGGLPAAIKGGLSLSASGFPYFASDIGGYRGGMPTEEVLLRWAAYAALLPIMQLGGAGANHNPWDPTYSAGAVDVYRVYARLHMDLVPWFLELAARAAATGRPITAPAGLLWPDDLAARADETLFAVGETLLVAPVVEAGATTRDVHLPEGRWIDWWTGAATDGPTDSTVAAPLDSLPLWQRAGTAIPMGWPDLDTLSDVPAAAGLVDAGDRDGWRVWRIALADGAAGGFTLADGSAATASVPLAGGAAAITLADGGNVFTNVRLVVDLAGAGLASVSAVTLNGMGVPPAAGPADLDTCGRCWIADAALPRLYVALDVHDGVVDLQP